MGLQSRRGDEEPCHRPYSSRPGGSAHCLRPGRHDRRPCSPAQLLLPPESLPSWQLSGSSRGFPLPTCTCPFCTPPPSASLDLSLVCLGDVATVRDATPPMLALPGVGVNLRTGEVFPIADSSMERGPDLNLRTARTLAASGGKVPGMLSVYDCLREQLAIGPFTYEPMRAVDIWLGQPDDFLVQSLCPCPEAVGQNFAGQLRAA